MPKFVQNIKGMKGIILAGGSGTRLHPITRGISKQLIPIYNKPMVYYPLSALMLAGVREVLVITTPHEQELFRRLLEDGSWIGLKIKYAVQEKPEGLAQAFLIGRDFIGKDDVAMVLGDNLFYGHDLPVHLRRAAERKQGATVFAYQVRDPERYGVITFDANWNPTEIIEKPKEPRSTWAVTGIYFYDNSVVEIASKLKPSPRGELEITDVNREYLKRQSLHVERLGRGIAWLDTGTYESLLQAALFIETLEQRQGLMVACVEEIAYRLGYITSAELLNLAKNLNKNSYGEYLMRVLHEGA